MGEVEDVLFGVVVDCCEEVGDFGGCEVDFVVVKYEFVGFGG